MGRKIFSAILLIVLSAVLSAVLAACSPAVKEAADITKPAETGPQMLYPAYAVEENLIETGDIGPLGQARQWGFIDESGKFVIQPEYDYVEAFQDNGLAVVVKDGKYGIIDRSGKLVIEPKYQYIRDFREGLAVAGSEIKNFVINEKGQVIVENLTTIDSFSSGLAVISNDIGKGDMRYGYIDSAGKQVIDARFVQALSFVEDRAVVRTEDRKYQIIDRSGNVVKALEYDYVGELAEKRLVYRDKDGKKMGYLDDSGKVVIPAAFYGASMFQDGLAIVRTSEDYFGNCAGVIDTNGIFVIKPEYTDIIYLGKGYFAAVNTFIPSAYYAKKAVISKDGKQLTDYKYYEIAIDDHGMISVNDGGASYFVNESFEEIKELPRIEGSGILSVTDNIVKAEVDHKLIYMTKEGRVIWQPDHTVALNGGMKLIEKKYRPDRGMLIYYPELSGHPETTVQSSINSALRQAFVGSDPVSEKDESGEYAVDTNISYNTGQNKELLIIEENGYIYPIGAAHGMPIQSYRHIDMRNGTFYELRDLFKKDSGYLERLGMIVGRQIAEKNLEEGSMFFDGSYTGLREDQGFVVTRVGLRIYFEPYEIAAYAAGFPTFEIPYGEIIDIIDTEGALWNAFDK